MENQVGRSLLRKIIHWSAYRLPVQNQFSTLMDWLSKVGGIRKPQIDTLMKRMKLICYYAILHTYSLNRSFSYELIPFSLGAAQPRNGNSQMRQNDYGN